MTPGSQSVMRATPARATNSAIHDPSPPHPHTWTDLPRKPLTGRLWSRRVVTSCRSSDILHHSTSILFLSFVVSKVMAVP